MENVFHSSVGFTIRSKIQYLELFEAFLNLDTIHFFHSEMIYSHNFRSFIQLI